MVKIVKSFFNNGVKLISINRYKDKRGFLLKIFDSNILTKKILDVYISKSKKNVFRGLHYVDLKKSIRLYACMQGNFTHYFYDTRAKSETKGALRTYKNNEKNIIIMLSTGIAHGVYSHKNNSYLLCLSNKKYNLKYEKIISCNKIGIKLPKNSILSEKDEKI
jgi:dTDP-4-dehydrorhamnose 3,5-epimerase-like enzyme